MKFKVRFIFTVVVVVMALSILSSIDRYEKSLLSTSMNGTMCPITGNKWIVTVADSLHSDTLLEILSLSNWRVMVIGQEETLKNWPEQFSSYKLMYLSFEEQMKLKLHSVRYISYGLNAQKNIGYLVAILCGAEIIYELDSNNFISDSEIQAYPSVQSPGEVPWLAFRLMRSPFVNIYGIFGQPQIWPRGLPSIELRNISEDGWSSLRRNENEIIKPYIQQQVVDFDPDLDAVAQLAFGMSIRHISFDHDRRSVALEPFTFSPYNCKNTIYYRNALWGLYLPITIHPRVADIWRGFWVQRLLWDIGGHLMFTSAMLKRYDRVKKMKIYMKDEQMLYDNSSSLARFLSAWKHNGISLLERIQEIIDGLVKAKFLDKLESESMRAWLRDLDYVKYKYPLIDHSVENISAVPRVKRAAVCLTGLAECVQEVWAKNEMKLRKRLKGDIDVFLFLSIGDRVINSLTTAASVLGLKQARFYNATINIIRQDILDIDPGFPSTCKYQYIFTERHKIKPIEQERYAQAACYSIVRDYEKKRNTRYQLLIRARTDNIFLRLPNTFERKDKFNPDNNILIPNEHHYFGLNDRFAIGPMKFMKYYMSRWYDLPLCFTDIVHPESFLAFVLRKNNVRITKDIEISLVQMPHGGTQCH